MNESRRPVVLLGCDHAAFPLKERLKTHLEKRGVTVRDVGTGSEASVDYPLFAARVAAPISSGEARRGILLCGTGIGMSMAANRFPHVRAALCNDVSSAVMSRRHNDANILVLGGRVLDGTLAEAVVDAWLDTPFEGGRHRKRLELFDTLERLSESGGE